MDITDIKAELELTNAKFLRAIQENQILNEQFGIQKNINEEMRKQILDLKLTMENDRKLFNDKYNMLEEENKKLKEEIRYKNNLTNYNDISLDLDSTSTETDNKDFTPVKTKRTKRKNKQTVDSNTTKRPNNDVDRNFPPLPTQTKLNLQKTEMTNEPSAFAAFPVTSITVLPSAPSKDKEPYIRPNAQTQNSQQTKQPSRTRVPPIVIRDKNAYPNVSNYFKMKKFNFSNAVTTSEGVKIFPCTPEDYRGMTGYLEEQKVPFHTFSFPEEKSLHIVIRGVLESWSTDKVKSDLIELGFSPSNIYRWFRKDGSPLPLMLVILPKSQKSIFDVKSIDSMRVRIESQRTQTRINQCHRCQLYGHSQTKCRAIPKCLKCAGDHLTHTCQIKRPQPATCANCGLDHPANFRGCAKHPQNINPPKPSPTKPTFVWGSQNIKELANDNKPPSNTNNNFPSQISDFVGIMQNSMQQFMQTMHEQLQQFIPMMLMSASGQK